MVNISRTSLLFEMCVFLIVLSIQVAAQQVSYESAAVGRIVGDSPGEMKQQLAAQDLQLDYASYFGDNSVTSIKDTERAKDIISVLEKKFKDGVDAHFVESLTAGRWDWEDVTESLGKWKKGSLLVVEAHGNVEGGMAKADSPAYLDSSLTPLNLDWSLKSGSLAVFDSDFAGARLPKVSSFAAKLNKAAVVIAPTAVPDKEFVKVFMCNLGKYRTLGETYRESRNNYYWQTNRPSGIALMSYELYGNPTATVGVPSYDEEQLKELCKGFLKDYAGTAAPASTITISALQEGFAAISESGPASAPQQYTRESTLLINDYSVIEAGEYSFLVANRTTLSAQEGKLMLPVAVAAEEFPPKTVITGVRTVAFEEPVEVKVENLPMWYGEPVKRECNSEASEAGIDFSNSFTGGKEIVTVAISPVEVVSCSEGKLKLYKKARYAIDYIPFSPVLIKDFAAPSEAFPSQGITATVVLQNLQGSAFEGELVLSSMGSSGLKEHVAEKKVSFAADQQETAVELAFAAPADEGIISYRLEFIQDGEAKTFHEFSIKVKSLELSLTAPATAGESGEATLTITNSLTTPISAVISSYLLKGEETVTATQEKTLEPGPNEVKISYEGLKREDASYSLLATVNYGSGKETAAATLVTNHPPLLESVADVTVTEGEKVVLSPAAADIDGDEVQISYTGKMESSEWQTNVGDAGSYETTITASDGLLYDSQTIKITVLEDKDVDKDGFEKDVDCNDNDASINPAAEETCNNIDDNCDSSTDESLQKTEPCGYCGTTTTVCGNGQWLANVTCEGQGPCSQGTEETQSCGYGGKQFRKCSETCAWTQWSECGSQGECQAGDEQEQKCGTTDTGTCELGTQSRTCRQDYYWELWSECSGNIEPAAEVCDGLDNNCNGEADDGLEDLNSDGKCDSPPVMAPVGNRTVKENETLSIALAAYDFNEDKLAFSSSQLPKGASLAEGVFSWTPTFNQAGTYSIEFAVSDGLQQDKESINVTVANVNRAPEAKIGLEPPGYYVNEGEFRLLRADVFDPDNDHLEYTWWYLGNADWWQQGKSKLLTKYKSVYFFPNYTDGDGYNAHKFMLNVSDGSATINATIDLVVVNVQGCKPRDIEKAPCGLAIGACRQGQKNRTCSSDSKWSEWTECVGGVKPQPAEDCGTLEDEDCNGIVNNGCGNSPDLTTTWMSWKLYDTSSGEIPIWSISNASVTMRPYLYGEVANIGSDDSPPALMAWYLNSRLMARTELPRLNASEKAQVFAYMPYPPYEGVNNISLIVDANSKIREENENNNQISFPLIVNYNETHKAWAKQYGEDYYLKFPTQEECETQGKCW